MLSENEATIEHATAVARYLDPIPKSYRKALELATQGDEQLVKLLLEDDIGINSKISGSWNHLSFRWLLESIIVPSSGCSSLRLLLIKGLDW